MSAAEERGVSSLGETGTQLLHEAVSAELGSEAETFSQAGQRNFRSALEKQTELLETPPCSEQSLQDRNVLWDAEARKC